MKILVFTSLYPNNIFPNLGVFIKERMRHVAQLYDCEVRVVAPIPYFPRLKISSHWLYSQVARTETQDGLIVEHPRYFMTPKIGMSTYGRMIYLSLLPFMKKLHKEFDFDLIDAHYVYPDGHAAVLLGKHFNKPVIVSARGSDINQFADMPLIRKKLCQTMQHTDHNIAVCGALKKAMVDIGAEPSKVTVIANGVDGAKFFPMDKKTAQRQLGLTDGKIILSVGQLIPRKGMDILIKSFANVVQQSINARLIIAGEGPSRPHLLRLVDELGLRGWVHLVGAKAHSELNAYYNAADLFCLASSREGWPNVVMESLACGTPVVATNIWGTPEIITSESLGLLTERNVHAMTQKLLQGINKQWDRELILQHIKEHTWERAAGAVHQVFASVLHRGQT